MRRALLISVPPVDGYPPVQAQARLLATAGFSVTLITTPLPHAKGTAFAAPGVNIIAMPALGPGRVQRIRRLAHFVAAITSARRRARPDVEVAYDPIGMLYSDLSLTPGAFRIAHFHELLGNSAWIERRLTRSIRRYDSVVVPDPDRGKAIAAMLGLSDDPLVVPNYPPLSSDTTPPMARADGSRFEVVFCGSLGRNQKLDLIIASIAQWSEHANLTLIGAADTPEGRVLKQQVTDAGLADRVAFSGWLELNDLPARLAQADLGVCLLDDGSPQFRTALLASNKRFQYMQAGLPQIGDMNPGVPDLLEGNGIGRCISDWSAASIALIVNDYVADRHRVATEGAKALGLHRSRFNYQTGAAPLMQLIEDRCAGTP